jgi:hypothetical protein
MPWLQQRMLEADMAVEDDQLLNGGTSPNLSGINDTGNFTASTSLSTDNPVRQLVRGIIQLRALGRKPTGIIIIHPLNYENVLLNIADGSGEFNLPSYVSVNATGGVNILGVPVVDTTAQTLNRYNIIDNNGSLFAIRQIQLLNFSRRIKTM